MHLRRGHGGAIREHGGGFVAAAIRHRTSRAQDPHLHTHVIVANMARTADGEWRALDGDAVLKTSRLLTCGAPAVAAFRGERSKRETRSFGASRCMCVSEVGDDYELGRGGLEAEVETLGLATAQRRKRPPPSSELLSPIGPETMNDRALRTVSAAVTPRSGG